MVTYIVKEGEAIRYVTQSYTALCEWYGNRKDLIIESWYGAKCVASHAVPVWEDYHFYKHMTASEVKSKLGWGLDSARLIPSRSIYTDPKDLP